MKDKGKILTVINTSKKTADVSTAKETVIVGGGGGGVSSGGKSYWEFRKSEDGTAYLWSKYPVLTQYGITMYANMDNMEAPQIVDAIPFDNTTIWYNTETNKVEVIGGGSSSFENIFENGTGNAYTSFTISEDNTSLTLVKGETFTKKSEFDVLNTKVTDFLEGEDTDVIINKWKELETFLSGLEESDNLAEILSGKADKATTLAGYGITDAYTKTEVDDSFLPLTGGVLSGWLNIKSGSSNYGGYLYFGDRSYVYLHEDTDDHLLIHANSGVKIETGSDGTLYVEGNLVVSGGITMYATDSSSSSTIMDGVLVDDRTISKANGYLEVIGGTGGSVDYPLTWSGYSTGSWDGSSSSNIAIPSKTSQLTNDSKFLTTVAFSDVTGSVANSQLANSSVTIAGTNVALGGSITADTLISGMGLASKYAPLSYAWVSHRSGDTVVDYEDLDTYKIRFSGSRAVRHTNSSGATTHADALYTFRVGSSSFYGMEIYQIYDNTAPSVIPELKVRYIRDTSVFTDWKTLAFTDSDITGNAATATLAGSATKLATARNIWGQSFNGTADVTGAMTNVGSINGAIAIKYASDIAYINNVAGHSVIFGGSGYADQAYYFRPMYGSSGATKATVYIQNASASSTFTTTHSFANNGDAYHLGEMAATSLSVNGIEISKSSNGYLYIDGDVVVNGGIVMYGTDGVSAPDVMSFLTLDPDTLKINSNGELTVVGGTGGASSWSDLTGKPSYLGTSGLTYSLTVQANGTTVGTYNGSSAKTVNINYSNLGLDDRYLKLTGGTIEGTLTIQRSASVVKYANSSGTTYGWLGFDSADTPVMYKSNGSTVNALLHAGNYDDYALPLSGGKISGGTTVSPLVIDCTSRLPYITFSYDGEVGCYVGGSSNGYAFMQAGAASDSSYSVLRLYPEGKMEITKNSTAYDVLDGSNYSSYNPKINGSSATSSTSIYAPTSAGTSGYVLKSNGSGAPTWTAQSNLTVGQAANVYLNESGNPGPFPVVFADNSACGTAGYYSVYIDSVSGAGYDPYTNYFYASGYSVSDSYYGMYTYSNGLELKTYSLFRLTQNGTTKMSMSSAGNFFFYGSVSPNSNAGQDLGTSSYWWDNIYGTSLLLRRTSTTQGGKIYFDSTTMHITNSSDSGSIYFDTNKSSSVSAAMWLTYDEKLWFRKGIGGRQICLNGNGGGMYCYIGTSAGWSMGVPFLNSSGTVLGNIAAYGAANSFSYYFFGKAYNDYIFKVDTSGNVLATGGITMYSDVTKKNILNDEFISIDKIANAPSFLYTFKDDEKKHIHLGSSAQYWQSINKDYVKENDGTLSMGYGNIALTCAISISKEVVALKERIKELENEIKQLKTA